MCYQDKTFCLRYNIAVLGSAAAAAQKNFGVDAGSAAGWWQRSGGSGVAAGCEVTIPSDT